MPRQTTLKQKKFIKEYLKTGNSTQAAMITYNCNSRKSASVIGTQNLAKLSIKGEINRHLQSEGIDLPLVIKTLKNNLISGSGVNAKASDSNRAAELLLKTSGAFEKGKNVQTTQIYFLKGLENLSTPELINRRNEIRDYFSKIKRK